MPHNQTSFTRRLLLLFAVFIAARICFILLMPHTYSKDLYAWLQVMDILEHSGNPYQETNLLGWPPFWMQVLFGIQEVSKHLGIPRIPFIQGILIGAEALLMYLVWTTGSRLFDKDKLIKGLLFGIALNPVCIFLTCQHCNFDVFVGIWVVLTAAMLVEYSSKRSIDSWLMACFFIGMGIFTKTIPFILSPLLLVGIKDIPFRSRIFGTLLLFTPVAIGLGVILALQRQAVMQNVIGYRSLAGWYGITGLLHRLGFDTAEEFYEKIATYLLLGAICFASWWSSRKRSLTPLQVVAAMAALLIFIPTFGPGYSPPYILWYLPLLVLVYAGANATLRRLLAFGLVIAALTYTTEYAIFGSHGAFLLKMIPSENMADWSNKLSVSKSQVLIRLPLFIFYLVLFRALLRLSSLQHIDPVSA